jgi:hypothetical protein
MIAEAVKLAVPGARYVSVDLQTIRFTDPTGEKRYTYLTPRRAQVALVNFDQGRAPEPFKVQLRGGVVTKAGSRAKKSESKVKIEKTRKIISPRPGSHEPEVNGGRTPPVGPLSSAPPTRGKRRTFGLNALEM